MLNVDKAAPSAKKTKASAEAEAYGRRVGTVIKGKWQVDALLGVGGMAAVYAATHRNGQRVALKILHPDFSKESTVASRFLREAYVSNKVGHPSCVSVFDDDVTEQNEPFLVMELLLGETLRQHWQHAGPKMAVDEVLRVVDPILDCLQACHKIGVIHRDLKPANIFLTSTGTVKVLDFGIAQFRSSTTERTAAGTALGTPSYMSPEQAMGLVDQLDGRADLFSVGAMMHALLTGQRINKGRTENEALVMAATKPVPSIARLGSELPVDVIALVDKALAWDRRNRFATAQEMRSAVISARGKDVPPAVPSRPEFESREPPTGPSANRAVPGRQSVTPPPSPSSPSSLQRDSAMTESRLTELRDVFKRIDRLLPTHRQMGWEHPQTERATKGVLDGLTQLLLGGAFTVHVEPHSLSHDVDVVWEPFPPFDVIPYHLFAAGVRELHFHPGLSAEELREFLAVLLLDPDRDPQGEDDSASILWEKQLPNLHIELVDALAEGDADEREAFFNEADELERSAANRSKIDRLEAQSLAKTAEPAGAHARGRLALVLPPAAVLTSLAGRLKPPRQEWSERFVGVLLEAIVQSDDAFDGDVVATSVRRSALDLFAAGRADVALGLHASLTQRVRARTAGDRHTRLLGSVTAALFGGANFAHLVNYLAYKRDATALAGVLSISDERMLVPVLETLRQVVPGRELLVAVSRYLERAIMGQEAQMLPMLAELPPSGASVVLSALAKLRNIAARSVLERVSREGAIGQRIEAKVLLEGSDVAHPEILTLCTSGLPADQIAALENVARLSLRALAPSLLSHAQELANAEADAGVRFALFKAIVVLGPERSEPFLVELAKRSSLFGAASRDATRWGAIRALGDVCKSEMGLLALREIAQAGWGRNEEIRRIALEAAEQVSRRIGARP